MANCLLYCCPLNTLLGTWMCLWARTITEFFLLFLSLVSSIQFIFELHFPWTLMCQALLFTAELFQSSLHPRGEYESKQMDGLLCDWLPHKSTHFFCALSPSLHLHNDTFKGAVLHDDLVPALSFVHHNKLPISPSSITSPPLSPVEMLTGSGGAALLISPGGLTALSQAVMVTHRCSTCSNTAAKDGRS